MRNEGAVKRYQLFRRWLRQLEFEGKYQYVAELEMWVKSFERYFRTANLPLSDDEQRQVTLRDYSEELKIVNDVIFRISQVCTLMLTEEQVSYSSFTKYVENTLKQNYFTDSYMRKLMREHRPGSNLNLLMEALLDVRGVIIELSRLSKISYVCFTGVGRIVNRELRKGVFFDFFLEKKYSSIFDRIHNPHIVRIVHAIQIPQYKRSIASVFIEFHRLFRYLNAISLQMEDSTALKRSLLIFSLIHAELKLLIEYLQEEYVHKNHPDVHFKDLIEGIIYSLSMELKKVMQKELVGIAALRQYDLIFSKVQNSQGILMNSLQQIVFSIAQYFDPKLQGHEIFPDYVTKLDQSLRLRSDIYNLRESVRAAASEIELSSLPQLVRQIEWFKSNSMKFLMFKDWYDFDNFYQEIRVCKTNGNLAFSLHRFDTFLTTLIKEVNKRAILFNHPFDHPLQ